MFPPGNHSELTNRSSVATYIQSSRKNQLLGLFEAVFATVDGSALHSVSLGPFRLPTPFFRRLERLYADDSLVAGPFEDHGGMVSYRRDLEEEMVGFCTGELLDRVPREVFFPCAVPVGSV